MKQNATLSASVLGGLAISVCANPTLEDNNIQAKVKQYLRKANTP